VILSNAPLSAVGHGPLHGSLYGSFSLGALTGDAGLSITALVFAARASASLCCRGVNFLSLCGGERDLSTAPLGFGGEGGLSGLGAPIGNGPREGSPGFLGEAARLGDPALFGEPALFGDAALLLGDAPRFGDEAARGGVTDLWAAPSGKQGFLSVPPPRLPVTLPVAPLREVASR